MAMSASAESRGGGNSAEYGHAGLLARQLELMGGYDTTGLVGRVEYMDASPAAPSGLPAVPEPGPVERWPVSVELDPVTLKISARGVARTFYWIGGSNRSVARPTADAVLLGDVRREATRDVLTHPDDVFGETKREEWLAAVRVPEEERDKYKIGLRSWWQTRLIIIGRRLVLPCGEGPRHPWLVRANPNIDVQLTDNIAPDGASS